MTITNVNDGTNGRSVTNVSQKWRLTTTTATPTQAWSDAGWLTTQPTTTATNKYLWSITRTTFNLAPLTQDVIEQKAVYGDKGDKEILEMMEEQVRTVLELIQLQLRTLYLQAEQLPQRLDGIHKSLL